MSYLRYTGRCWDPIGVVIRWSEGFDLPNFAKFWSNSTQIVGALPAVIGGYPNFTKFHEISERIFVNIQKSAEYSRNLDLFGHGSAVTLHYIDWMRAWVA